MAAGTEEIEAAEEEVTLRVSPSPEAPGTRPSLPKAVVTDITVTVILLGTVFSP